ncbi:hypothetical protein FNV43_RR18225 [Rhamnella rubrinervis]|uniref:Uncharacterized protein n=1 Tax=Rhamnella rubrinervis TaxID=2594499 RepID=A0A8K0GSQ4_9ROSA|nr:hypothetical protein FNV43_RR18225 [Rhamnella rubrinervis]
MGLLFQPGWASCEQRAGPLPPNRLGLEQTTGWASSSNRAGHLAQWTGPHIYKALGLALQPGWATCIKWVGPSVNNGLGLELHWAGSRPPTCWVTLLQCWASHTQWAGPLASFGLSLPCQRAGPLQHGRSSRSNRAGPISRWAGPRVYKRAVPLEPNGLAFLEQRAGRHSPAGLGLACHSGLASTAQRAGPLSRWAGSSLNQGLGLTR